MQLRLSLILLFCTSWTGARCTTQIAVALHHGRVDLIEARYWAVADPWSPSYGQFMSAQKLGNLLDSQTNVKAIVSWISGLGGTQIEVSPTRDLVWASIPDKHISHAFLRLHERAVPRKIRPLVDAIWTVRGTRHTTQDVSCSAATGKFSSLLNGVGAGEGTPDAQKEAYGVPKSLKGTAKQNQQMVWGPCTYGVLDSDLTSFWSEFNIDNDVSLISRPGFSGVPGGDNFVEGTLDAEYITAMGPGVPTIVSNTNASGTTEEGPGFGDALLQFVANLASSSQQPPLVLSISLGSLSYYSVNLTCTALARKDGYTYAQCINYLSSLRQVDMYTTDAQIDRINVELMKLGLRGTSVLAAAGDGGSHFSFVEYQGGGIAEDLNTISCAFQMPTFPSSSPYVTSVGGTSWTDGPSTPVHWSSGGGGFSWASKTPSFQAEAVKTYLSTATGLPPSTSFNPRNRGYPDVAALAVGVPIVNDGETMVVGGTSASTPEFAGLVSLLNDHRLNNGLHPLGPLNPRLYQVASEHPNEALYDITQGNTACAADGYCCDNGFPAVKGWDPATGLGSPRWDGLVKYLGSDDMLKTDP